MSGSSRVVVFTQYFFFAQPRLPESVSLSPSPSLAASLVSPHFLNFPRLWAELGNTKQRRSVCASNLFWTKVEKLWSEESRWILTACFYAALTFCVEWHPFREHRNTIRRSLFCVPRWSGCWCHAHGDVMTSSVRWVISGAHEGWPCSQNQPLCWLLLRKPFFEIPVVHMFAKRYVFLPDQPGETPQNKVILMAAAFLIDYMYFENKNNWRANDSCNIAWAEPKLWPSDCWILSFALLEFRQNFSHLATMSRCFCFFVVVHVRCWFANAFRVLFAACFAFLQSRTLVWF